jgi:hypothetical protein
MRISRATRARVYFWPLEGLRWDCMSPWQYQMMCTWTLCLQSMNELLLWPLSEMNAAISAAKTEVKAGAS